MKVLVLLAALFFQLSASALICEGEGYTLSIINGTATLNGPNISLSSELVRDQGNYFTASFKSGAVRSLSVSVFSKTMTLVTTRGIKKVKVNCSF